LPSARIIGAGVFGAWIAHALNRRGWTVTLIDQHGPANARASSGGETRIIRSGYGALAVYAAWARDSLPEWLELERAAGEPLFVRTGALFLGANTAWLQETIATLDSEGIEAQWLAAHDVTARFPQLSFDHTAGGVFEPRAGVLFARRGVQALVRQLVAGGVRYEQRAIDPEPEIRDLTADALVFACGAWLPTMFPAVLAPVIFPTRQEVFFFGPSPGDDRFRPGKMPAWVAFDEGIYGVPDLEHRGVKVAIDAHGEDADPERMERTTTPASVKRIREILRRHVPSLAEAPLVETRVCQYENTSNGHLLLDQLPGHDRVWIAGGGSGHGFKHGPAVGRYLADLIEGRMPPDRIFQVAGRPPRRRTVY
jgi:monomeric sarcosine oxidase